MAEILTSSLARVERRTTSTVPSVTFFPTLIRKGIPMRSASLNLTPGRSSRSSSKTSQPAASSCLGDVLGGGTDGLVLGVGGDDDNFKGRDGGRQPESVFVVILFDGGGEDALDADAVTAHDGRDFFAVAVENASAHGVGILVAEFEDVSDFDGGVDAERRATVGAGFSGGNGAEVDVGGGVEVLSGRQMLDVVVLFIGAADEVGAAFEGFVDETGSASLCLRNFLPIRCRGGRGIPVEN
jgi:hypothetical protein